MNVTELSLVPPEARRYQGTTAGVVTRAVASVIDTALVGAASLTSYVGVLALWFVLDPRGFQWPDASPWWAVTAFLTSLVLYLTSAWSISGRTFGDHVLGVRVVSGTRSRLRPARAFVRSVLSVAFPVGLLWCAVDRDRRSLQDVVVGSRVIRDWLPRPA